MDQWFTLQEVKEKSKACPMSIGQAEAGRYTFCVGDQCMAWTWDADQIKENKKNVKTIKVSELADPEWEKWYPVSKAYDKDDEEMIDVMLMPERGRCGMVPKNVK